jgi:hypothetical protein
MKGLGLVVRKEGKRLKPTSFGVSFRRADHYAPFGKATAKGIADLPPAPKDDS